MRYPVEIKLTHYRVCASIRQLRSTATSGKRKNAVPTLWVIEQPEDLPPRTASQQRWVRILIRSSKCAATAKTTSMAGRKRIIC